MLNISSTKSNASESWETKPIQTSLKFVVYTIQSYQPLVFNIISSIRDKHDLVANENNPPNCQIRVSKRSKYCLQNIRYQNKVQSIYVVHKSHFLDY